MPKELDSLLLHELIFYVEETDQIIWKERSLEYFKDERAQKIWNTKNAGKEAFTASCRYGYHRSQILNQSYLKHRVVWALVYGKWPEGLIDHIDGNRSNNRPSNLRLASETVNHMNARRRKTNKSGVTGVHFCNTKQKYVARYTIEGHTYHVGYFGDIESAKKAIEKERKNVGFGPNHGSS